MPVERRRNADRSSPDEGPTLATTSGSIQLQRSAPPDTVRASIMSPFTAYSTSPMTDTIPVYAERRSQRTVCAARSKVTRRLTWIASRLSVPLRTGAVFIVQPFHAKLESGISYSNAPVLALLAVTFGA